jgi:hypothetical protein
MVARGTADAGKRVWLERRKGRGGGSGARDDVDVDVGNDNGCACAARGSAPTQVAAKTIIRIKVEADLSIMQSNLHQDFSVRRRCRPRPPRGQTLMIDRLIAVVGIMRNRALV